MEEKARLGAAHKHGEKNTEKKKKKTKKTKKKKNKKNTEPKALMISPFIS
jgi:hypothetical protein